METFTKEEVERIFLKWATVFGYDLVKVPSVFDIEKGLGVTLVGIRLDQTECPLVYIRVSRERRYLVVLIAFKSGVM